MRITITKFALLTLGLLLAAQTLYGAMPPEMRRPPADVEDGVRKGRLSARVNCAPGLAPIDQDINNVRARLWTGGDVWWNGADGRYIVPKPPIGEDEISSIYAAAVWLGGFDEAGTLKLAAQQYGRSNGNFDFYPGPLDRETGEVSQQQCSNWDKFFVVNAAEIREHNALFQASLRGEIEYTEDMIPLGVKGWPGRGNPYFQEIHGFEPQDTRAGLAGFFDYVDEDFGEVDGLYDPLVGDFPIIEIEGCEDFYNPDVDQRDLPQFPDQMIFWIYNDNGNVHENSGAQTPLQMEVQVQAFSYATNDALNNMTFQRYKLINRGKDPLTQTFFGIWVDGDLGCANDDFIGCDTTRSLAIYYNTDPLDGDAGVTCGSVPTYGSDVPLVGIDYFRGPKEFITVIDDDGIEQEIERELGMSSFTYFIRGDQARSPGMSDPSTGAANEFYNLLSGNWKDGTPYTAEGDGYQTNGFSTSFAFPTPPRETSDMSWSMCSENLGAADRRTIQASGPFDLRPTAVNELIIGVPWIADEETYPCPQLDRLLAADDLAQNLFDACFDITDGPDAPDLDIIELDRTVTLVLTNDEGVSNNAFLEYAERDLLAPDGVSDSLYRFEGYKVYQLRDATVSIASLDDPSQARLIAQSDVTNGVGELFNWRAIENPLDPSQPVFEPIPQVEDGSLDEGVGAVIRVTTDQFASGQDTRLINHKPYYFTVLAYAFNSYGDFNPVTATGQPRPYLEGRNNVRTYTAVPRPIVDVALSADGGGAAVRRLDGVGSGPFFLDLATGERERLIESGDNMPRYQQGESPVVAQTYNPFVVQDAVYRIEFIDDDLGDDELESDGTWRMVREDGTVIIEGQSFASVNEQIIGELGISVSLGQVVEPGSLDDQTGGCIGYEITNPNGGVEWFGAVPNKANVPIVPEALNFVQTETSEEQLPANALSLDGRGLLSSCFEGEWVPYILTAWRNPLAEPIGLITPSFVSAGAANRRGRDVDELNNVDIVFTNDKSLWSRCVIVESANPRFVSSGSGIAGLTTEGDVDQFDLRAAPSVGKEDADGDGLPDPDGDGEGMGWFPGYAIDVETGQRLNIFFGENSAIRYDPSVITNPYNTLLDDDGNGPFPLTGRDMMFNPTTNALQFFPSAGNVGQYFYILGGHHYVYVTREPYDECEEIRGLLARSLRSRTLEALVNVNYTSLILPQIELNSYAEGLIPAETVVKLRVQNPYDVAQNFSNGDRFGEAPTGENSGHPAYELEFQGVQAEEVPVSEGDSILSFVNVVPNPYYGYSEYEISEFSNLIRITNLPPRADITIYTLDGKFIRQYKRAEELPGVDILPEDPRTNNRAIESRQIYPDLDWDMKNEEGIPVASGVYLIHVDAFELGQRTLKAFLLQRAFDPSGL